MKNLVVVIIDWVVAIASTTRGMVGIFLLKEELADINDQLSKLHEVEQHLEYVEGLLQQTLKSYNRAAEVARSLPGGVEALARAEGRYFEDEEMEEPDYDEWEPDAPDSVGPPMEQGWDLPF